MLVVIVANYKEECFTYGHAQVRGGVIIFGSSFLGEIDCDTGNFPLFHATIILFVVF